MTSQDTTYVTRLTAISSPQMQALNDLTWKGRNPVLMTTTGTATAYVATLPSPSLYSSIATGDQFTLKIHTTNTGAATLTIIGSTTLTTYPIVTAVGGALSASALTVGQYITVVFDGTSWRNTVSVTAAAPTSYTAYIYPKAYGAVGDGVTDDAVALNATFAALRAALTNTDSTATIDLGGLTYLTGTSLNATGLISWGWKIQNGTIIGKCTGKPVLDMVGSRGGCLSNVVIDGSSSAIPSSGIQAARSGTGIYSFCDNMYFDNISIVGYYSVASILAYGQETTTYNHCRFWNYNPTGRTAIFTGYYTSMTSLYLTPITGATSHINNKYINCDFRYLPITTSAVPTAITKAASAVITAAAHPFTNGMLVTFQGISGMTQINNLIGTVSGVTTNTFTVNINSTAFGTFTGSGSVVQAQTFPSIYVARAEQQHFDTCYTVAYGQPNVVYDFPDPGGHQGRSIWFDMLNEGAGSYSHLAFTSVTSSRVILDFKYNTYNSYCTTSLFSSDNVGSNTVSLYRADISLANSVNGTPTLIDIYGNWGMFDASVFVPSAPYFNALSLQSNFQGTVGNSSAARVVYNTPYSDYRDGNYTPTVSSASGTITSYTSQGVQRRNGNMMYFQAFVTITNAGTGAGACLVSLPAASQDSAVFSAINATSVNAITAYCVQPVIGTPTSTINVVSLTNTSVITTGASYLITGNYSMV